MWDLIWTSNYDKIFLPYTTEYNKEKNQWKLKLAVAGYTKNLLEVCTEANKVIVTASPNKKDDDWITHHSKLALRGFEFEYQLYPQWLIDKVTLKDGILEIIFKSKTEVKEVIQHVIE